MILIDTETTPFRRFGFSRKPSGYSNLERARQFLRDNGVPAEKITVMNPDREDPRRIATPDAVVSMKACGFHFPVSEYLWLFSRVTEAGGTLVLDIRKGSGGIPALRKLGTVTTVGRDRKLTTIRVQGASLDVQVT